MKKLKIVFCLLFAVGVLFSCKKDEKRSFNIKLEEDDLQLKVGEVNRLKLEGNVRSEILKKLYWYSTDRQVVTVNNEGLLNAVNEGKAEIIVQYNSSSDTCIIFVTKTEGDKPLSLSCLNQPLSGFTVFSQGVHLKAPKNSFQSFDLDNNGNIYYSQIGVVNGYESGQSKAYEMYIFKGEPNTQVADDYMTLKYFGHTSNIAVEDEKGSVYIWVNSNASRNSEGGYSAAQSVSRIKYEAGKIYGNGYGGESFFLPGKVGLQPALDKGNDLLCINANSGSTRYFYVYRLSEALNLPVKNFSVKVMVGGLETGTTSHLVTRTVPGRDLSELTPIGSFIVHHGSNEKEDVNSYPLQGFDIDGSFIYFNEGLGYDITADGEHSQAYVTVFDFQGNIVVPRVNVAAVNDVNALISAGLTNNAGYMEPEGIKIKGDQIYLGYASRNGFNDDKWANILRMDCQRK